VRWNSCISIVDSLPPCLITSLPLLPLRLCRSRGLCLYCLMSTELAADLSTFSLPYLRFKNISKGFDWKVTVTLEKHKNNYGHELASTRIEIRTCAIWCSTSTETNGISLCLILPRRCRPTLDIHRQDSTATPREIHISNLPTMDCVHENYVNFVDMERAEDTED
jgi:hypothetical protein